MLIDEAQSQALVKPGTLVSAPRVEPPLLVLKFGSSVLRSVEDLPRVAGEIYRQRRRGAAILAVVSALEGETDRLFAEAASIARGTSCTGIADLVSLGEARTVALLRIACDRIGLPSDGCQAEELGLITTGGDTASTPTALQPAKLRAKLARTGLVIAPGFVGVGADGARTLLERGGSDFTAIYIAGEVGASVVRLYKDADGVFEADPNRDPEARRYDEISWHDALRVARPLIQPQAVEYAAAKRLPIEIEAIGSASVTRVGPETGKLKQVPEVPPIRVGIAGYGTVGQAVARRLAAEPRFEIVSILVRDDRKHRDYPATAEMTTDPERFLASQPDMAVDALSCERTSLALATRLLSRGTHVATANKRMVSASLADGMASGFGSLACSAAVGGGAPILETIARTTQVESLWAILNGTVNFVLTAIADGASFVEALARARAAGFAEEDVSADLSGADAAAKLRIIAGRVFRSLPPQITTDVLDAAVAQRIAASGERWVQVSRLAAHKTGCRGSVSLIPLSSLDVTDVPAGEWNYLFLDRGGAESVTCLGRGAGGAATAEAVIADLYDFAAARPAGSRAS